MRNVTDPAMLHLRGGVCLLLLALCGSFYIFLNSLEKGKPVERRGRKAAGPSYIRTAGLPMTRKEWSRQSGEKLMSS